MSRAYLLLILLTNQTSSCPSLAAVMWILNLTLSMMLLKARWTCMLQSEQPGFAIALVHLYQEALNNSWKQEAYFTAIFFQSRDSSDWSKYKESMFTIKEILRETERNYTFLEVQQNKSNPSSLWKVINRVIPSKNKEPQRVYTKDLKTVADEFNVFFTSVGKTAASLLVILQKLITSLGQSSSYHHRLLEIFLTLSSDQFHLVRSPAYHPRSPSRGNSLTIAILHLSKRSALRASSVWSWIICRRFQGLLVLFFTWRRHSDCKPGTRPIARRSLVLWKSAVDKPRQDQVYAHRN